MSPTECVKLVKFIAARCPAMRMQDETPDAWYVDLRDFDMTVALEAARTVSLDKTFIGIGDLVRECEAIIRHAEGLARRAELEAQIAAENPGVIVQRDMPAIEAKRVPEDEAVRAERRRMLQAAAHAKRQRVEADTTARNAERERLEQARAELDAVRESAAIHGGGGS